MMTFIQEVMRNYDDFHPSEKKKREVESKRELRSAHLRILEHLGRSD